MQILCYNCHTAVTVNSQSAQVVCPNCQAVNLVANPVHPGVNFPVPQYQAPTSIPSTSDNRRVYTVVGFAILGLVSFSLQGWGIALGLAMLAWALAGALGKVKSPIGLVFPDLARTKVMNALSFALGASVVTCGLVGVDAASDRIEHEALDAEEKQEWESQKKRKSQENEAAIQAERERKAAEEATARAAHKAKLRTSASSVNKILIVDLDAIEALIKEGKWREADEKMQGVESTLKEYLKLDPPPEEIVATSTRQKALGSSIDEVMTVLGMVNQLEMNLTGAEDLTRDTTDGSAWSAARSLWRGALANIDTLQRVSEDMQPHVPNGLDAKRREVEKRLRKADKIVAKYEYEQKRGISEAGLSATAGGNRNIRAKGYTGYGIGGDALPLTNEEVAIAIDFGNALFSNEDEGGDESRITRSIAKKHRIRVDVLDSIWGRASLLNDRRVLSQIGR